MGVYPPAESGNLENIREKKHANFPSIKKQNCFDETENHN